MVKSFLSESRDTGWIDGYKSTYRLHEANPHLAEYSVAFRAAVQAMVDDGELARLREEGEGGIDEFEKVVLASKTGGGIMEMKTLNLILLAPRAVLQDALLYMVYCDFDDVDRVRESNARN